MYMYIPDITLGDRHQMLSVLITTQVVLYLMIYVMIIISNNRYVVLILKGNILITSIRQCTDDVKIRLFNSLCTNNYSCTFWTQFSASSKRKIVTSYKLSFRYLLKCKREGTTFKMITFNVDPCDVIIRKLAYSFRQRLYTCHSIINSLYFNVCKQWSKILLKQ